MPGPEGETWELTASQLGIWYAQQLNADNPMYNQGGCVEIRGDLDLRLFEAALRRSVSEAEAFHLRFCGDDEAPQLYVDKSGQWQLHVIDLSTSEDPDAVAEEWMRTDMLRPANLHKGPLFTQAIFKARQRRFFWYQRVHHIAMDGHSLSVVAARQAQVYTLLTNGRAPDKGTLEPISVLTAADSAYRDSAKFNRDRQFWLDAMSDLPKVASVSGMPTPANPRVPDRHLEEVDAETTAAIKAVALRLKVSVAELMVASTAVYLHRSTGANDIVIGLPVIGRAGQRMRYIPGMTVNTLPIRLAIGWDTSVEGLTRQVSGKVRDALRHQLYRYEDILRDLRWIDKGNLFSMIVNISPLDHQIQFGKCRATLRLFPSGPIYDMRVSVDGELPGGGMRLSFDTNGELYSAASAENFARRFRRALAGVMTASPGESVGRVEILEAEERRQILSGWSAGL
jgi:Condensation domain